MKKLTLLFLLINFSAMATNCNVVGISDGDTLTCLTNEKEQIKVRLAQIDAPEKGQDFGNVSRQELSKLVYKKNIELKISDYDKYGRAVAEVFADGVNVNKEMVLNGYAWAYKEYLTDDEYLELEKVARENSQGLWNSKNPVYPSNFRKNKNNRDSKKENVSTTKADNKKPQYECGKQYCKEMRSCKEAYYHLNVCGVDSLDRDDDGIPCEKICKRRK